MSAENESVETITLRDESGLTVCFAQDGRLLEAACEGSTWRFRAPCCGWSLHVQTEGDTGCDLRPASVESISRTAANSLRIVYGGLLDDVGREFAGTVEVEWQLVDGLLQGRILRAELPDDLKPSALAFPDVRVPYGDAVQWVAPHDVGQIMDNPCAEHVEAVGMPGERSCRAHMQFTAWLDGGCGLYLDSRDSDGWIRAVKVRVGEGTARVSIEHLLPQPGEGPQEFPGYCVSIAPFVGDWYEAARIYRRWALRQPWAARGPDERRGSYIAELACWLWNRGRIANVLPATKEMARRLGLPVALDWYWWHKKPYDAGYPDYFPPREGHRAFCAAVKDLQENNVAVQVYTNGMSWDQAEPDWESQGRANTIVQQNGEYYGIIFNTWMNRRLMQMCGPTEGWHLRALKNAESAAGLGLDGLYIDMIGVAGGHTPCYSAEHGHVPGGGPYGMQGFRELFRKVREQNPGLVLSSEGVQENYQDLLEAGITLYTSWERLRGGADGPYGNATPIPLFPAVYHGHFVVFGNYAHIDGITPYDELWPAESRTDPADEKDWHSICPDQFALELARTIAFGCQPLVTNLTIEHLTQPKFQADAAFFLDISRFYHAHREWLLWGEMLAPEQVHCGMIDVTCIKRMIFTRPDTIEPFTVQRPAVLHSAWRAPDGEMGLVLINYSREDQDVKIERDDGLRPQDGERQFTLPARSMRFVPLVEQE